MKKVAFHTLGCKVNQVETEQMIEEFCQQGYQVVGFGDPADVYVVNTCTVTHISDRKSRAILRRAVRANPQALVVATGCAAQVAANQLASLGGVGLIIGNQEKDRIVDLVEDCIREKDTYQKIWVEPISSKAGLHSVLYGSPHQRTRAFVKIQDGCQAFCSYCIVPFARGPVRSKAPGDVVAEIRHLIGLGYREIVLTGIHTGLYGIDLPDWDLTKLVQDILDQVSGDYRIRLSSIEPLELNDRLLNLVAREERLCRHLHIPLQSGSDRILQSMGRRYDRSHYHDLVLKAQALIPGVAITADVMVGYPTETEADFQATYDLIDALPLYELHVFKYSRRVGTRAAELTPQIAPGEKRIRSARLLELGDKKKSRFIHASVGERLQVLVERQVDNATYLGISDNYMEIRILSSIDLTGQLISATLVTAEDSYGVGRL